MRIGLTIPGCCVAFSGLEFSTCAGHQNQGLAAACTQPDQMVLSRLLDSLEVGHGELRIGAGRMHVGAGSFPPRTQLLQFGEIRFIAEPDLDKLFGEDEDRTIPGT